MNLESVLIRQADAKWPHAYEELAGGWKVSWADPDGDGNYCVVS